MRLAKKMCKNCVYSNDPLIGQENAEEIKTLKAITFRPGKGHAMSCHHDDGKGLICCRGFYENVMLPAISEADRYHIAEIVDTKKIPLPDKRYSTFESKTLGKTWYYDMINKERVEAIQ